MGLACGYLTKLQMHESMAEEDKTEDVTALHDFLLGNGSNLLDRPLSLSNRVRLPRFVS